MKINTFKSIATLIAICFLSFGIISSSDADIEITDMYVPSETYNNGYFYLFVYADTDKPFDVVDWYIADSDADLQYVGETLGDGVTTRAYFYPDVSDCPGHIKGREYRVAAKVWYYDDDDNSWSDYDSRDFTVFRSISTTEVEDPPKKARSTRGYSELTRQYYTGDAIKIDCYVYAYCSVENRNKTIRAWSRFKHALTGKQAIVWDHPLERGGIVAQPIGGKHGSYSRSDTLPHFDINLEQRNYTSDAYVRLIVQSGGLEDHYLVTHSEDFTSDDEPYNAADE